MKTALSYWCMQGIDMARTMYTTGCINKLSYVLHCVYTSKNNKGLCYYAWYTFSDTHTRMPAYRNTVSRAAGVVVIFYDNYYFSMGETNPMCSTQVSLMYNVTLDYSVHVINNCPVVIFV